MKLMYITNNPDAARIAEQAGVDRIFVDLEVIGKAERQGGMDTVQSHHTIEDIRVMRRLLTKSELLVRVNQIHPGSEAEIREVIDAGADILMLPYFKTPQQVADFLRFAGGRVRTMLLVETPEAVACIDEILAMDGIDECYVGLNDLHLGYKQKFLFEPLTDGTTEALCKKFRAAGKPYGFGGIAKPDRGLVPANRIIGEHVRLGSSCVILSRSFCNPITITDPAEIREIFEREVPRVRAIKAQWQKSSAEELEANRREIAAIVDRIKEKM